MIKTTAAIHKLARAFLMAAVLICITASRADNTGDDVLAAQRSLFLQTRAQLQSGATDAAAIGMAALRDYPLFPYLELLQLTKTLDQQTGAAVDFFLQRYDGALVAEQLRNQWLAVLADGGRWRDYLKYYRAADASRLQQCWAFDAWAYTDQPESALTETTKLLTETLKPGSNFDLPDACDGAFKRWLASNQRNEELIWKRLLLALDKKQDAQARALLLEIREPYKAQAEFALQLYRDPVALNHVLPQLLQGVEASAVIAQALKNLARQDVDAATVLWQQLSANNQLSRADSIDVRREIGRREIVEQSFDALPWLLQYDPNGEDSVLLEWRVRLALRDGNWPQIANWIALMPPEMAQTSRWNYWLARALAEQRDDPEKQKRAAEIFSALAKERSFYGFLAADRQQSPYRLNDQRFAPAISADAIAQRPGILRAREFFALGEQTNARREWQFTLRGMTADEQQRAALLAAQWEWHDQALRTANQIGSNSDLRLRFPLAYRDNMAAAAKATTLPIQWLYAITRQESAFMADARSPVGALGLMQLMPDTAKQVARGLSARVSPDQLLQPATNILLGSNYLNGMFQRFDDNRILATAAYNAGPTRISRWLKNQTAPLPADVWVEVLPYRETREYVQSVLTFAVIYGERLGQPIPLLRSNERSVGGTAALSATLTKDTCAPAPESSC